MKISLNPFELEKLRTKLLDEIKNSEYLHLHLFDFNNYFLSVLDQNDSNIHEAFLTEFIPNYKFAVSKFDVWGININTSKKLLTEFKLIFSYNKFFPQLSFLENEIFRIEQQLEKLNSLLQGKSYQENHEINFPLIYKPLRNNFIGIVESLKIRINKSADANNILIIPSEKVIEDQILNQCKNSWNLALDLSKKYINKFHPFHEVIISFTKKIGFYEGNSLGIALTIAFLEQILKFYNPAFIISINDKIGFTGGISDTGKVFNMNEEIIRQKINVIFFSNLELFVCPKSDEIFANDELEKLKEIYPKRNLKIISVEEISDVLNRRDLVDIKKQKIITRSAKFIKKHSVGTVAIFLSLILFSYILFIDLDDNPAILDVTMNMLFVKNKSGKILWTKNMDYNTAIQNLRLLKSRQLLVDINNDNVNEVILTNENYEDLENKSNKNRVVCFDKNKKIIWQYNFRDRIIANSGPLDTLYGTNIFDTLTINNKKTLFCFSASSNSFSSAIFQLDLKTGKRINGTLWNSGHFTAGFFKDLNNDNKKELLTTFYNNGLEQVGVMAIETDKLNGQCPTTFNYTFKDKQIADLMNYIIFPKTDFTHYIRQRMEGINADNLIDYVEQGHLSISISIDNPPINFSYLMNYNMKDFDIIVGNSFRIRRDSLVVHGKLKPPLTDTEEYCNILKSQIKYWNGKEFIHRNNLN